MESKTLRLFFVSGLIVGLIVLGAIFHDELGLRADPLPMGVSVIAAVVISAIGLILGFGEMRRTKSPGFWVGFVGNMIVVGAFVLMILLYVKHLRS